MAKIINGMINGTKVFVKSDEPIDKALRKFKKKVQESGILLKVRSKEAYEKPTLARKKAKASATKREQKRLSKEKLRPNGR